MLILALRDPFAVGKNRTTIDTLLSARWVSGQLLLGK